MKAKEKAIIRIIVTVVACVNAVLVAKGITPIPFNEALVTEVVSYIFAGGMALWSWWKDAPMTKAAQEAHEWMKAIKEDGFGDPEEGDDVEC